MLSLYSSRFSSWLWLCTLCGLLGLAGSTDVLQAQGDATKVSGDWKPLLKERSLEGWEKTNFGGEGPVDFNEAGELVLGVGEPLTGIHHPEALSTSNFEIRWEANRLEGSDFLACLTFPIGSEYCSFICGGWGGGLIGISSIDGNDASENQTTQLKDIANNRWYRFLVHVDDQKLVVSMDDEEIISVKRDKKRFSIRAEVSPSRPLGYCVFKSKVAVRGLEFRQLDAGGKPISKASAIDGQKE
jgi:hypothetical protein